MPLPLVVLIVAAFAGIWIGALLAWFFTRGNARAAPELTAALTKQGERLEDVQDQLALHGQQLGALGTALPAELGRLQQSLLAALAQQRQDFTAALAISQQGNAQQTTAIGQALGTAFDAFGQRLQQLTADNGERLRELRTTVDGRLKELQSDSATKLEAMRATVDEKLQATLETRLGESFKQVSDRLEQVHRGLGEMATLATGVGDLKRVLTNVKTRGGWGEMQLETLLEQLLTPEQFARQVCVRPGLDLKVDFAIRLPGRAVESFAAGGGAPAPMWIPIDAKFPREDYDRLVDAAERGELGAIEVAARALEIAIKTQAKSIAQKYIEPPHTTDFALMFLPTEGLYAEVLRRPGLADHLQREHRVIVAGPTTLTAVLNSLQMGFRTLAIEQRSSEVWKVLGAVKTEFGKFGDVLGKVSDKLAQAQKQIEETGVRSRAIQRQLRAVESLPAATPAPAVESQIAAAFDEDEAPIEPLAERGRHSG